jgi:hypothetical protein
MSFDIFRVDWLLISGIISVILIIFLIGVNILKKLYRWRFSFSNENLEKTTITSSLSDGPKISKWIKKRTLIYPKDSNTSTELATIIIYRSFRKFMLLNALTEGLSSYGFNIINVWFKKQTENNEIGNISKSIFSKIIELHNDANSRLCNKYFIITSSKIPLNKDYELIDSDNLGVIIINPNMKEEDIVKISERSKFYGIISEKLILFVRNPNLKRILKLSKEKNSKKIKIKVIKSAKRSFRYYETILLGELIKIVKSN